MRIAVLEDEPTQMEHLVYTLEHQLLLSEENVSCVTFERGEALRRALRRETFDLLILDWNVPDLDGANLLQWLRQQQQSDVPVIMLSSRSSQNDVAEALGFGADDYLVKPLRPLELIARIQRLLLRNRRPKAQQSIEHFGDWVFDRPSLSVRIERPNDTQRFDLTEREFRLALALFRKLGQSVSRAYLMESMGNDGELSTRALDSQIYRLRAKLGLYATRGLRLQTIYGQGYRLETTDDENQAPSPPAT
ncbi:response regulator transcription factor [Collimonas sp. NPDC087041]|uniref:response regulator transcription factor n=1 Tax=Collimonas sp. NPDC087041 TaxID=3363960 RepID=UPI003808C0CD